jgi:hypothetical protein
MAQPAVFKRTKRLLVIHLFVQVFLVALLLYMAFRFQGTFRAKGMPQVFLNSIITSVVVQLLAFWPISKFAAAEARREVAVEAGSLTAEQQKGLRQKRLLSDFLKASVFLFFAAFIALAPGATFVMSTAFFCFILATLTYFQCYNAAARRAMKD